MRGESVFFKEGGFVCCDGVFLFFLFLFLFLFWALSFDLFRCCWKFWAGLMLHGAAATHTDSKQQQRERKKREKSKIAVCAVVVI